MARSPPAKISRYAVGEGAVKPPANRSRMYFPSTATASVSSGEVRQQSSRSTV